MTHLWVMRLRPRACGACPKCGRALSTESGSKNAGARAHSINPAQDTGERKAQGFITAKGKTDLKDNKGMSVIE